MFGTRRSSRTREAQHVAEQAWEQMVTALESAGDAARSAGRRTSKLADGAQSRAGSAASKASAAAEEARKRAGAAVDALAGRRAPKRWSWILGAAAAGLAFGWLMAAGARKAISTMHGQGDESDTERLIEENRPVNASVSTEF